MGERRGAYRGFVGNPKGKRPLGKSTCRWEKHGNGFSRTHLRDAN
jgi:hypothetical protein